MTASRLYIAQASDDPATLFENLIDHVRRHLCPPGILPDHCLPEMKRKGHILSPHHLQCLFQQNSNGTLSFLATSREELTHGREWQEIPASLREAVLLELWMPSHINELTIQEITNQAEPLEEIYALILNEIIAKRIRFKNGSQSLKPNPTATSKGQQSRQLEFLTAVSHLDRLYEEHRFRALQNRYRHAVSRLAPENPDMIDAFTLGELTLIQEDEATGDRGSAVKNGCRRLLIRRIAALLPTKDSQSASLHPGKGPPDVSPDPPRSSMQADSLDATVRIILEQLPTSALLAIAEEKNSRRQRRIVKLLLQRHFFQLIPDRIKTLLGSESMNTLSPAQMQVLLAAINEKAKEKKVSQSLESPQTGNNLIHGLHKFGSKIGIIRPKAVPTPRPSRKKPCVEEVIHAIGPQFIPQLAPEKLAMLLAIKDDALLNKIARGFNQFLPHVRSELIQPLARLYDTPVWKTIKALRFVNSINPEIIDKMNHLVEKNLLDVPFARLLAQTFRTKIKQLQLYHLEEVEKNDQVILFFKEKFLQLKKGVVRLVVKYLDVIRANQEIIPYIFKWRTLRLDVLLGDAELLRSFLAELQQAGRRRIIFPSEV